MTCNLNNRSSIKISLLSTKGMHKLFIEFLTQHVDQKWISDLEIAGPTFVTKGGYFFTNLGKACQLAFLTKCWLFRTRSRPFSQFLAFLAVVF